MLECEGWWQPIVRTKVKLSLHLLAALGLNLSAFYLCRATSAGLSRMPC